LKSNTEGLKRDRWRSEKESEGKLSRQGSTYLTQFNPRIYYFAKKYMFQYELLYFIPDVNKLSGEIHVNRIMKYLKITFTVKEKLHQDKQNKKPS
jgi:hypothetical protein